MEHPGWFSPATARLIATTIFVVAYIIIASEKLERAKVAVMAACLMIALGLVSQQQAFGGTEGSPPLVEWNVIFLLSGMMIIVTVLGRTGVFEWLAIKSVHLAKGRPAPLIAILSLVTALASMFLDNVTTVILIAPVTITLARTLRIDPVPLLIAEVIASNVGGTATLIGDPPNIIIGSHAGIGFMPFLTEVAPAALLSLIATTALAMVWIGKPLRVGSELRRMAMDTDAGAAIKDPVLLKQALVVLFITIGGFLVHGLVHLEPATIALFGAAILMLISKEKAESLLSSIEWSTIFFFIGLFIMVGALVEVGIIELLGQGLYHLCGPNIPVLSMVLLWMSALISAIVDNIPYVTTMCPVVETIARDVYPQLAAPELRYELMHHADVLVLWWSLALGACLGGNATLIGASANVVVAGIAEHEGYPISFMRFLKYGVVFTLVTLLVSTAYLWLRWLIHI